MRPDYFARCDAALEDFRRAIERRHADELRDRGLGCAHGVFIWVPICAAFWAGAFVLGAMWLNSVSPSPG